jgi:hypothetical protein
LAVSRVASGRALAPIPEPLALLTLALGLGALATLRRVAYCG